MSTVIGAMEAYLKLNIDDFEKNLKAAKDQVASISSSFDVMTAVGDKISGVGTALTLGLTTPIVGLGTACVKTTSDFDAAMSKVSAISGATGDDLEALREKAKDMGAATKFSATESAEAFTYMAMAGWDTEKMLNGIAGIMNLAAADGLDLATTSDIVTDALTAFGLQASDSAHFADVLAKASSAANTNVSMLGESFKYVAPVAGAMGYSAEDVAVALGLMANSGIKAGQAGTAMRAALTRMAKPTDNAAALMEQYNLSITNSDGSMKSLAEVMVMLRENMGDLTEAEQIQAATTIFGQEAMSGMLAIVNASDTDFDNLTRSINNADGTAQQMADTMNDNLSGQLVLLKSQLEGVAIQIGEILVPIIRKMLTGVSEWISKFSELFKTHGELILKIAAVVAAIGPVLTVVGKTISTVGKLGSSISNISSMLTAAGTSFGAILGPILVVVAVVAVLVAAFKHLWDTNEEFREAMTSIWEGIVAKVQEFCQGIVDRINSLGFDFENITEVLKAVWNEFCNFLAPIFEGVFSYISVVLSTTLDVILGIVDVFIAVFKGDWQGAWDAVKGIFTTMWNGLVDWFDIVMNTLKGVADVVLGWFGTNWETVWTSICDFFVGIWNSIVAFFEGIATWFQTTMTNIGNFFTDIWTAITTTVTNIVNGFVTGVQTLVSNFVTGVTNFFTNLKLGIVNIFNAIAAFFTNIWTSIKTTVSNLISGLVALVNQYFGGMSESVSNIFNGVRDFFTNIWTVIKNFFGGIVLAICDLITGDFDMLKSDLENVMTNIQTAFSNIWNAIKEIFTNVVNAIVQFVTGSWNLMKDTVVGVWNALCTAVTSALNSLKAWITSTMTSLSAWFTSTWNSIKNGAISAWEGLKTGVVNAFDNAKTSIVNTATSIWNSVVATFNNVLSSVVSIFNSVKTSISTTWSNIKAGASSALSSLTSTIISGFNNAVAFIKALPGQAMSWGTDMIQGFANGVKSAMNGLLSTVQSLASQVRSFLHFTRPDRGPLRDYETWMPDMVQGLSKTLDAAAPGLIDRVKELSGEMAGVLNDGNYQVALAGVGANIRAGGSAISRRDYSALERSSGSQAVETTQITIEKIEVRDDHDLDMVTQGLYNKQDQNLRALGRRNL